MKNKSKSNKNIRRELRQTYALPQDELEEGLEPRPDSPVCKVERAEKEVHLNLETRELVTSSGERRDYLDCDTGGQTLFVTPLPTAAAALVLHREDVIFVEDTSKIPDSPILNRDIVLIAADSSPWASMLYEKGANCVWTADENDFSSILEHRPEECLGVPSLRPLQDFQLLGVGRFGERDGRLCRIKTEKTDDGPEEKAIPIANGVPRPVDFIGDESIAVFQVAFESAQGTRTQPIPLTTALQSNPRKFREKFAGQRMGQKILQIDRERRLPEVIVEACVEQWPGVAPAEENETLGFDENLGGYVFEQGFASGDGGFTRDSGGGIHIDGRRFSLTALGPNMELPQIATDTDLTVEKYQNILARTYGERKSQLLFAWVLSIVGNILPWWRDRPSMLLNLAGPLGDGKTVCAQALTAVFCCNPDVNKVDQLTVRATQELLDFKAYVPVIFDDFRGDKPNHRQILSVLRSAYDRGKAIKGTPQKGETIEFIARGVPLITGEFLPHDETGALRSRCLVVAIEKSDRREDTLEEIQTLYDSASSLLPKLIGQIRENSEHLREVVSRKTEFFKSQVANAEMNGVDRLADLYAGAAAVREVILGHSAEVDKFFAEHLKSALMGVEEQSLVHEFLDGLKSSLKNNNRADEHEILAIINGCSELAIAKTAGVDAFKLHRRNLGESTSIRSEDITRHLKQYEGSWVADRSRTAKFRDGRDCAFVFDLEHPDLPAPVLHLAVRRAGRKQRKRILKIHGADNPESDPGS